jgi:hypothetical protein
MRTENEITERMQELNKKKLLVEERIQIEVKKPNQRRDPRILWFLDKERAVWEFALSQMDWILSEK